MSILGYDLGASSGRAMLGRIKGQRIEVEEIHRFSNDPVQVGSRLHWDILRILHEMKQGLLKTKHRGTELKSIAIDTWGVDFGLLGRDGELLGNPYHYRDGHTEGMMEKVLLRHDAADLFGRTGIQFQPFNTLYQLYAMKEADSSILGQAEHLLLMPELLRYLLTGEKHHEFSIATTTQLYNPVQMDWDRALIGQLGLPEKLFGQVVMPGTAVGQLRSTVTAELGISAVQVYAAAEHDTGSAVAAVPALSPSFAYLSCGTWSLIGTEVEKPVLSDAARAANFTNEGGVSGTFRLLKNIMGLWLLQESKRAWERAGAVYSFPELIERAEAAPAFQSWIDPDSAVFLTPGDMPARIRTWCAQTGQPVPDGPGEITRCILESLALKYRYAMELTEQISGKTFNGLHMVGGGINNLLLCQWTANAVGKPVWAGPAEGSAIGNLAVQWIAQGEFAHIGEARGAIRESFPLITYEPQHSEIWKDAYGRYVNKTGLQ
ncbi:carbohydrate kinase [Paenibacillus swuensis]|uniref:Carbohydrate kinase n=1 Tax=Paenibacillus swuensis TaxID=1178515 RepID=A0A172THL2_9BACL|nr:rhamnulokinase family protein [Paenibacillus swuensis]ANE46273.1 carbohydrate kinase [Paenibacillus swuensis]